MDTLHIRELAIDMIIGVYDWERQVKQRLLVDITLQADLGSAATQDNLETGIDYDKIVNAIETLAQEKRPKLIEHFAHCIAEHLLGHFPCQNVRVCVQKPHAIKQAATVSVTLERARRVSSTTN